MVRNEINANEIKTFSDNLISAEKDSDKFCEKTHDTLVKT